MIVITHKQEILSEVDQIILLKDGGIIETGNYNQLLNKSKEFREMLEMENC